jgi:hypothetical protein
MSDSVVVESLEVSKGEKKDLLSLIDEQQALRATHKLSADQVPKSYCRIKSAGIGINLTSEFAKNHAASGSAGAVSLLKAHWRRRRPKV